MFPVFVDWELGQTKCPVFKPFPNFFSGTTRTGSIQRRNSGPERKARNHQNKKS
jgi:hypothetical protein